MPLTMSCETFTRLAKLSQHAEHAEYSWLRSVALHRVGGKLYALATDACFCAVEFVAEQPGEPDDFALISTDAALLAQAEMEKVYASQLFFTKDDSLNYTQAQTSFGYIHPINAGLFPIQKIPLKLWKDWLQPFPKQSNGGLFLDVDRMASLVATSPSGRVLFPRAFDATKPVAVKDAIATNWIGFLVPYDRTEKAIEFTEFPAWVR